MLYDNLCNNASLTLPKGYFVRVSLDISMEIIIVGRKFVLSFALQSLGGFVNVIVIYNG